MKTRRISVILIISIACCFAMSGCAEKSANNVQSKAPASQTNQVDKVIEQQIKASNESAGLNAEIVTSEQATSAGTYLPNAVISSAGNVTNASQTIPYMTLEEMKAQSNSSEVDIDLTTMSADLVYASVFNILTNPTDYEGSTIKMNGNVVYSYSDDGSETYCNVLVADAIACCSQGLEFQRGADGEYKCPEDYPAENTPVMVTGTLETYTENDALYFRIGNAEVTIIGS